MPLRSERARRSSSGLLSALACGLLGCASESGDEPPPYATLPLIAGCEQESFAACDRLETECQARVFATMQCLRHMPDAVMPPVRVLTAAERRADIEEGFQIDPDELQQVRANERVLVLLGLARSGEFTPESRTALFVDTTAAYYSNDTGLVTLSAHEDDERPDLDRDTLTLAHEFVHALQDQDVGLNSLHEGSNGFDGYLGLDSLIEGEAEMLETFVSAAYWGFGESPDFRQHFLSWVGSAEEDLADVSPLLAAPRYIPYSYGARYVYDLFEQGGIELVRERLRDPPHSVLPILLSSDQLVEPAVESLEDLTAPSSLAGFQLGFEDTLGPWVFGKFLERVLVNPPPAGLMPSWRGDRILVYASEGTDQAAALWTVRLADVDTADRLQQLLQSGAQRIPLRAGAFISRRERDVTIGVSSNPVELPDWSAALDTAQLSWDEPASAASARLARPQRSLSALLRRQLQR